MMLIEISEPGTILDMIVAFFVGIGGLYLFYKVRSIVNSKNMIGVERLDYLEKQLIDMKIKLDAIEMQGFEQKGGDPNMELRQLLEKLIKNAGQTPHATQVKPEEPELAARFDSNNVVDRVLYLITQKDMTSRDIQVTLRRSREHTSRIMKKLFEDGYVHRTGSKPYIYSITQKGRDRIVVEDQENIIPV